MNKDQFDKSHKNEDHNKLLQMLMGGRSNEEIFAELPRLRWVILDSKVYDLEGFFHPGGNFIIEAVRGREVGRFLHGAYPLESLPNTAHKHSKRAFDILAKSYIGKIENATFLGPQEEY